VRPPQLCSCGTDEIRLFLVFSLDLNSHVLSLRAIDRTRERADIHILGVKNEARILGNRIKVWVDENMSDHLFGASMRAFLPKP
jgi:hypothetical protein